MATIVNNPPVSSSQGGPTAPAEHSDSGMGFFIGLLVVIVLGVLFFAYALPAMRSDNSGGTNINVPDRINVNVNQ